jgi:hypothetical protein
MDRGEQQNQPTQGVDPPPAAPQEQPTPQAALAAVTRGENPPPPAPPPKTDIDIGRTRRATLSDATEKYNEETVSGHGSLPFRDPYRRASGGVGINAPPRSIREGALSYHSGENGAPHSRRHRSGLDWIIPVDGVDTKPYTVRSVLIPARCLN